MGKRKSDGEQGRTAICFKCDPPDHVKRELGSRIGVFRLQHYLEFKGIEDLERHLRECAWFATPVMGSDFDSWLSSVLTWHRMKRALEADEERKWGGQG